MCDFTVELLIAQTIALLEFQLCSAFSGCIRSLFVPSIEP